MDTADHIGALEGAEGAGRRHRPAEAADVPLVARDPRTALLELKCQGLDAEQLARRSVPPSNISLLGLVRHMADVERFWFRQVLSGEEAPPRFRTPDDRDADFNGATGDPAVVDEAWAAWREEVAYAERSVDGCEDLGTRVSLPDEMEDMEVREILVHMIEEYARHCGHADLLRERIDGRVGV